MGYKVLYRKYRPNNFNEIVGQEYIVQTLKNSIITDQISHAYIFSGPRGTGKTSMAKIFAKTINCLSPENGIACGKCQNCLHFNDNPDVIEIDAASNNGVNEIRELKNSTNILPVNSKYKVYIIDEFHMITVEAFNALLKTLEEPPSHVVFIMATTDIQKVPITILSRCQRFDFKKLTNKEIIYNLEKISSKEKIEIDVDAMNEIAIISDGGMRDALSLLDQLSHQCKHITLDDVNDCTGNVSSVLIDEVVNALYENNYLLITDAIKKLNDTNADYKFFINKLLIKLKDCAIKEKFENKNEVFYKKIKNIMLDLINEIENLKNVSNPYNIIQIILLDYLDSNNISYESFEDKEKNISREIKNNDENISWEINNENEIDESKISIRINNCFCKAAKDDLIKLKESWENFIDYVQNDHKELISVIYGSDIVAASNEYAIIVTENQVQKKLLNNKILIIEKLFLDLINLKYKLIAVTKEEFKNYKIEYAKNKKNNIKYEMQKDLISDQENNKEDFSLKDVFSSDIIEVQ